MCEVVFTAQVAYECLLRALEMCKPKTRYRDIGDVISAHASKHGCSVVKTYCGHGICDLFHCKPNVPHYARNKAKGTMEVRPVLPGHARCLSVFGTAQLPSTAVGPSAVTCVGGNAVSAVYRWGTPSQLSR